MLFTLCFLNSCQRGWPEGATMARVVQLASMVLAGALLASAGLSQTAHADTITYQLTFDNSAGVAIGSGTLTLDHVTTSSSVLVGPSGTPSDFVSLTGSIQDGNGLATFNITPANFSSIFFNSSVLTQAGITGSNGNVTGFAAPGSSDIFLSDNNVLQFTGNGDAARDTPGLDFSTGSITGTITVGAPLVAAVPEPSTWAM